MCNFNFLDNFAQFRCLRELNVYDNFFSWRKYRYSITGTISAGNTGTNFRRYRATPFPVTTCLRQVGHF